MNGSKEYKYNFFFAATIFLSSILFFALNAYWSLNLFEFGDESEKFVAVKMIQNGQKLYSEIFTHHGPLSYILIHGYINFFNPSNFSDVRWLMVAFCFIAGLAVFKSPLLTSQNQRCLAVSVFLFMVTIVWVLQSIHMLLYNQIAGFLIVVPIVRVFIPLIMDMPSLNIDIIIFGIVSALLVFIAYTFIPSVFLLLIILMVLSFSRGGFSSLVPITKSFLFGFFLGVMGVSIWLYKYGDFTGYLVYHYYFNQIVYSKHLKLL
jgi:hypothetical protein